MSYPKALRDDDFSEVRPKRAEPLQTAKIPSTNPLSFADKSAQAIGPLRFEQPPQAMDPPPWDPPISPQTQSEFNYPSKATGPPIAVMDHPMKAKGYMKHAEHIKRELEDMQDKFGDLMSHAKSEELKRQYKSHAMSKENQNLEKKTKALELEVDSLKTGKDKNRKGDDIVTDIKSILTQNEQLYQANNKWGTAYHDLEDIYQRKLDEEEKIRKRMELKARQLAIENHTLKNKFSDYGKGREETFSGLGLEDDFELSDSLSSDSCSSDESDLDKVSPAVRQVMKTHKERRKMWKDLVDDTKRGRKSKGYALKKTDDSLKKKLERMKKVQEQLEGTGAKIPKGGGIASLLKGAKKKQVEMDAPDMRALMDHISILHKKLDRYRDEAKSIEGENKRLKDDMEFVTRRYQSMMDRMELGRGGVSSFGPLRQDPLEPGYGYGMSDRLLDYY